MKRFIPFLLVASLTSSALPAVIEGRVIKVSDGDTITVLDHDNRQIKIRMSGIDAPEKAQPYGQRAKQNLSRLVFDKEVRVDWNKRDKYKRTLGKVWVQPADCRDCEQSLDANLAQLTAGMAWWYRKYANEQPVEDQNVYSAAEAKAQAKRVGLWSDPTPMPPWEWRHR